VDCLVPPCPCLLPPVICHLALPAPSPASRALPAVRCRFRPTPNSFTLCGLYAVRCTSSISGFSSGS
jgi:hypothetical protein